jgi:hypothetical protein
MKETMHLRRWMFCYFYILLIAIIRFKDDNIISSSYGVMGYKSTAITRRIRRPSIDYSRDQYRHSPQQHQSHHQSLQTRQQNAIRNIMMRRATFQDDNTPRDITGLTTLSNEVETVNNNGNVSNNSYWNEAQLMSYANDEGIVLSISKVGPLIRTVARTRPITIPDGTDNSSNDNSSSILLGYVEGFVRPTQAIPFLSSSSQILHLDKMEVFRKQIQLARTAAAATATTGTNPPTQFRNGGTILGVGLLLGYLCVLDYVNNCNNQQQRPHLMTEFLAIDDETFQHERLVKYYTTAGFRIIKYVGDDFGDIPDRLVWGGCGTLLRQNCVVLLQKWTKLMERSASKRKRKTIDTNSVQKSIELAE